MDVEVVDAVMLIEGCARVGGRVDGGGCIGSEWLALRDGCVTLAEVGTNGGAIVGVEDTLVPSESSIVVLSMSWGRSNWIRLVL